MTFNEKEIARENKAKHLIYQDGKCFYFDDCKVDFIKDNVYPEAAHIIIDSKVNTRKYGKKILGHYDNFILTCKNCNSKAILNPETQSGKDHIQAIKDKINEEAVC